MRNYAVEMGELIAKATDGVPYEPSAVAQDIVEQLVREDLELLQGYLLAQAPSIIREAITSRAASLRMMARRSVIGDRVREICEGIEAGQVSTVSEIRQRWLSTTFKLADGKQHALRTMGFGELNFVASEYEERAAQNSMEAAFFRALAAKVPEDKTVEDVFTEEQIVAFRRGLAGFR